VVVDAVLFLLIVEFALTIIDAVLVVLACRGVKVVKVALVIIE